MRSLVPSRVIGFTIGALILVGVGMAVALLSAARPPGQQALEQQLRARRSALEALVQLINEDRAEGFCDGGAGLEAMQQRVSAERLAEYRGRLDEASVRCVWRDDGDRVRLTVWAFGFPGTEHARGFVWSREPLPNEFPCVDSPRCFPEGFTRKRRETVHARIDPEWVVFAF